VGAERATVHKRTRTTKDCIERCIVVQLAVQQLRSRLSSSERECV
jgi:hypothetical protein